MQPFVVLASPDARARAWEETAAGALADAGWRSERVGAARIFTRGSGAPPVQSAPGGGVAIGEVFARPGAREIPHWAVDATVEDASLERVARAWLEERWGAYVVVWPRPEAGGAAVLRDPSGALEAFVWRREGATVVSSVMDAPGLMQLRPPLALRSDRIAAFLGDATEIGGELAFSEIDAVAPGQLWRSWATPLDLWSPGAWARKAVPESATEDELAEALRVTVGAALGAYAALNRPLLAEISGGLDSAIMAQALAGAARVGRWLHVHTGEGEADERIYARAVADRLGVELSERARPFVPLSAETVDLGLTARPALSAMDVGYERIVLEAAEQVGAWGVVTGQGGDTVFYSFLSGVVAADPGLRKRGLRRTRLMCDLAKATNTSFWRVRREARRADRVGRTLAWAPLQGVAPEIADVRGRDPTHPWVRAARSAPAAKRDQILGLAYNQLAFSACRRTRELRLIHGPMLQPIVELCLRIPAHRLVAGARDRALARRAFARALPASVVSRRAKGDLTRVYGQELAKALPFVRERLLEGRLRALGLLDLPWLEARLSEEALMQEGGYGDILELVAVETWVRAVAGAGAA